MWIKLFFFFVGSFIQYKLPGVNIMDHPADNDDITLHLMISAHNDAGWIYTFDQYYQGTHTPEGGCVKCLLDNVLGSLSKNSERKYNVAEVSFFKRWWSDQSLDVKNKIRTLVDNEQFGFINGGWVANDEATAYYEDIMDNFILGQRWLKDNLNTNSSVGWQADSFGTSATQASLMAQAGYEGHFFSRADFIDREKRRTDQSLQFNWQPPNPHHESVFTQMLYVTYSDTKFMIADNFYCRSIFCHGRLDGRGYNQVVDYVKQQAKSFKTKDILFVISDDFLLTNGAEGDYDGAEAMIAHLNSHPDLKIRAQFSRLSDYMDKVKQDFIAMGTTADIPVKHDDFFPFIEKPGHVWTGYFTSKSMFKLAVREYSQYYNAVKLLLTKLLIINSQNGFDVDESQQNGIDRVLNSLEEPLAIVQHHDAVSGTMKEYVRYDYEMRLKKGRQDVESYLQTALTQYLNDKLKEKLIASNYPYDWLYQVKEYNVFDGGKTTTIVAFNPGNARKLLVKVKVPSANFAVKDQRNQQVETDTICHSTDSLSDCFIYFADNFPAYSEKVYKVVKSSNSNKIEATSINQDGAEIKIGENLDLKIYADLTNFDFSYCTDNQHCTTDSFNLDYQYYESSYNSNKAASGAYVFTPGSETKKEYSKITSGRIFEGKVVKLIQIFRNNIVTELKVALYQPEKGVEIVSKLDPVTDFPNGKEIVLLIKSKNINNGDTVFYTDANGYYMQKRVKDHKDDYNIVSEGPSTNYYPMTSNVYIEDSNSGQRLSLVTDRAQGATSLKKGEIEVMIHRVTVRDDWKGVSETLQERDPNGSGLIRVTTRHYLSYSQPSMKVRDQRREQQYDVDRSVQLWFYSSESDNFNVESASTSNKDLIGIPDLVKFYIRSYNPHEYVIRLHNLDEINSKEVQIYDKGTKSCWLLNEFAGKDQLKVDTIEELSWTTTRPKSEVSKNVLDPAAPDMTYDDGQGFSMVSLLPMEIRTFVITLKA